MDSCDIIRELTMVYEDFIEISCKALPEIVCVILGHLPIVTQVKRDTFLYYPRSKGTPSYTISGQKGHLPCSVFQTPLRRVICLSMFIYIKKLSLRMEISSHTSSLVIWRCGEKCSFESEVGSVLGKHWASTTCPKSSKNILLGFSSLFLACV